MGSLLTQGNSKKADATPSQKVPARREADLFEIVRFSPFYSWKSKGFERSRDRYNF
ncbi:hypothetical protein IQ249_03210 [Lusitaniella coriacea LEGE 07157]|uniref:Uncharacterized protein n=1 Tax=Lusitaniella coriacea LEGE 07157 TaxID=945747 RepID=A0A8J7AYH0_9CYAN|nr:hypothetical protein [Lusitaniella coriacea]MBE9114899.1 hypothetical protein [Lusitaniella coriacea LEGE 07157]